MQSFAHRLTSVERWRAVVDRRLRLLERKAGIATSHQQSVDERLGSLEVVFNPSLPDEQLLAIFKDDRGEEADSLLEEMQPEAQTDIRDEIEVLLH